MEYLAEKSTQNLHYFKDSQKTISIEADTKEIAEQIYNEHHRPIVTNKKQKITEVKNQANTLIEREYPKYKQLNFALGLNVNGYNDNANKNTIKTYIENIISQSETMEAEINALTTEEEVKNYKVNFS